MNIKFIDPDDNATHYSKQVYDIRYSNAAQGGPTTAEITLPINLIDPIEVGQDIEIYDKFDMVWFGRVFETPNVTEDKQAAVINCVGHINQMTDTSFKRLYSDISYNAWDTNPPVAPAQDTWAWDSIERDNNNRLFLKLNNGDTYSSALTSGIYYRRSNTDQINQNIYSVVFDYETGADYNSANTILRLQSYSDDFNNNVAEWSLAGSGALNGSVTEVITASKKGLMFWLNGVAGHTPASENHWAKITNIRVNGLSGFTSTYQADEVIKDILPNYCPNISTDYSKILTGTYTLPEFYVDADKKPLEVLQELNKYENYNYGFWDKDVDGNPHLTFEAHGLTTVHYYTTLRHAKPDLSGESLEGQYNQCVVKYNDAVTSNPRFVTRTATHALLDKYSITRTHNMDLNTTSEAAAQQAGDTFLDDAARRKSKGSLQVVSTIRDSNGVEVPVSKIQAGKNIMIRDLKATTHTLDDMTSANVLNGINIFKIDEVNIDAGKGTATLALDTPGDQLDILLARKGF